MKTLAAELNGELLEELWLRVPFVVGNKLKFGLYARISTITFI